MKRVDKLWNAEMNDLVCPGVLLRCTETHSDPIESASDTQDMI